MTQYFVNKDDLNNSSKIEGVTIKSVYLNDVMVTYMDFEPFSKIPLHKHVHEQISHVLKGKVEMLINGEKKILYPGDFAVIPSGIEHEAVIFEEFTTIIDSWSPIREDYK